MLPATAPLSFAKSVMYGGNVNFFFLGTTTHMFGVKEWINNQLRVSEACVVLVSLPPPAIWNEKWKQFFFFWFGLLTQLLYLTYVCVCVWVRTVSQDYYYWRIFSLKRSRKCCKYFVFLSTSRLFISHLGGHIYTFTAVRDRHAALSALYDIAFQARHRDVCSPQKLYDYFFELSYGRRRVNCARAGEEILCALGTIINWHSFIIIRLTCVKCGAVADGGNSRDSAQYRISNVDAMMMMMMIWWCKRMLVKDMRF